MEGDAGASQLTPADAGGPPPGRAGSAGVALRPQRRPDVIPSHRGAVVQVGTRDLETAQTQRAVEHFRL